jgi:hypothetical protein
MCARSGGATAASSLVQYSKTICINREGNFCSEKKRSVVETHTFEIKQGKSARKQALSKAIHSLAYLHLLALLLPAFDRQPPEVLVLATGVQCLCADLLSHHLPAKSTRYSVTCSHQRPVSRINIHNPPPSPTGISMHRITAPFFFPMLGLI